MEIWYDGADAAEISSVASHGWLTGITTNPRILSATPMDAQRQIAQLLDCQSGPVAVQVTATDESGMLLQADRLHALSSRIVIKVPVTSTGFKVISQLVKLKIPTLATAVVNAEQFLLSATMGVQYVAPYLSQMERHGIDPFSEIEKMQTMIKHYSFSTKVMAASLQSMKDIINSARLGVGAATLPPARICEWMKTHALTDKFIDAFDECWAPFALQYAGHLFESTS
jgi:transaldolase